MVRLLVLTLISMAAVAQAERLDPPAEPPHADAAMKLPTRPSPELSPDAVLDIQLKALQRADLDDGAMQVVFNFASPGNRAVTGPLERFDAMVRGFPYDVLVGHREVRILASGRPEEIMIHMRDRLAAAPLPAKANGQPDEALTHWAVLQVRGAEGDSRAFLWQLGKALPNIDPDVDEDAEANCWMTEAVTALPMPNGPDRPDGDAVAFRWGD